MFNGMQHTCLQFQTIAVTATNNKKKKHGKIHIGDDDEDYDDEDNEDDDDDDDENNVDGFILFVFLCPYQSVSVKRCKQSTGFQQMVVRVVQAIRYCTSFAVMIPWSYALLLCTEAFCN